MADTQRIPIAREAIPFIIPLLAASVLWLLLQLWALSVLFFLLGAFVLFFFRDPRRSIPAEDNLLVSPADGRVVRITAYQDPQLGARRKISIFLSIFNVHINRFPFSGMVQHTQYFPGRFLAAFRHQASEENERNTLEIHNQQMIVRVTQIAGLIARRIVCWKKSGDRAIRGERFGLIRFGSRVDLDLPGDLEILVKVGDHIHGGSDVVAKVKSGRAFVSN